MCIWRTQDLHVLLGAIASTWASLKGQHTLFQSALLEQVQTSRGRTWKPWGLAL